MRSHIITSALTIVLAVSGSIAPAVGESIAAPAAIQQQTSKIDKAIAEGTRLFKEGSVESLKSAISQFELVERLTKTNDNKVARSYALLGLGRIYYDLGNKEKALDYFYQAIYFERKLGNIEGQSIILNNIGMTYFDLGEQQKALNYFDQSLSLSRKINDKKQEAATLNNIGIVYSDLGARQKALDNYNNALLIIRSVGGDPGGESATLTGIAIIYKDSGDIEPI